MNEPKTRGPYKSARLKGIQGGWDDQQFMDFVELNFLMKTEKQEIKDAFSERIGKLKFKLHCFENEISPKVAEGIKIIGDLVKQGESK